MKKGTCKRFMAMAMSLVTALGTGFGGGVNMVYAANSFKAGDTVQVKYLHNNKTYKKSAVDARWNDKILGTKMPGYIPMQCILLTGFLDRRRVPKYYIKTVEILLH